jgi:hypothetical protein
MEKEEWRNMNAADDLLILPHSDFSETSLWRWLCEWRFIGLHAMKGEVPVGRGSARAAGWHSPPKFALKHMTLKKPFF